MKLLRLIPNNTNFDFLRIKIIAFFFSFVILSGTFISLIVNNLNYGIDFKGGILLELRSKNTNSIDKVCGSFWSQCKLLESKNVSIYLY